MTGASGVANKKYTPLRLMAGDVDDLGVVSACLQDAVAKVGDFAFIPERRRFAFVANRFLWEEATDRSAGPFGRVRVGVHFDDVSGVQFVNIRRDAKTAIVDLLSVAFEAEEEGSGFIHLNFAGGGVIRLQVDSINAFLRDISDPWVTRSKPDHD